MIEIEENQEHGWDIGADITATDEDTTAELVFSIDWTSSYATKSGRIISDLGDYKELVTFTYLQVTIKNVSR